MTEITPRCSICHGNYRTGRYEEHSGSIRHRKALERDRLERAPRCDATHPTYGRCVVKLDPEHGSAAHPHRYSL